MNQTRSLPTGLVGEVMSKQAVTGWQPELRPRRPRKPGHCASALGALLGQQVGGRCWRRSGQGVKSGPLLSGRQIAPMEGWRA